MNEVRVELNGVFLGYVKTPQGIPALLVEKKVSANEIENVRFSSVSVPGSVLRRRSAELIGEARKNESAKRKRARKPKEVETDKTE